MRTWKTGLVNVVSALSLPGSHGSASPRATDVGGSDSQALGAPGNLSIYGA